MRFASLVKSLIAGFTGMIVIAAILIYISLLNRDLEILRTNWQNLIDESQVITRHLNVLEQEIGFGGFNHNFKNYIIRKEEFYSVASAANLELAYESIGSLQRLLDDDLQLEQLQDIQKSLNSYGTHLSLVVHYAEKLSPQELDALAKESDTPILNALDELNFSIQENLMLHSKELEETIILTQEQVNLGYWLVVIVVAVSVLLIFQFIHLERAKSRAELSEKTRSEFLASMSHEIRTPLAGIRGIAGMVKEEVSVEKINPQMDKIVKLVDSLRGLLDDILDLSKLDAGKINLEKLVFDPSMLTNDVVDLFYRSTPPAKLDNLQISCRLEGDIPNFIKSDPSRIRQVLLNLVGNAVKFTERGEVIVTLKVFDNKLFVQVRDTGIGISKDALSKLFQDFTQADASISRKFQGTGLGLSISKRLVELMGGEISVESELHKGTEFSFYLPFDVPTEDEIEFAQQQVETHDHYEATRKLKILIAEDNEINQTIITHMIKKLGHDYKMASDGAEAIELVKRESFDIALLDIRMPNVSGPEVAEFIRKMAPPMSDIPIIAVTADVISDNIENYTRAGFTQFVPKPIELPVLVHAMDQSFDEKLHDPVNAPVKSEVRPEPEVKVTDVGAEFILRIKNELGIPEDIIKPLLTELEAMLVKYLENIEGQIEAKSIEEIKFAAHSVKGASGGLTFHDMAEIFAQIEVSAIEENWDHVAELSNKIETQLAEIQDILKELE